MRGFARGLALLCVWLGAVGVRAAEPEWVNDDTRAVLKLDGEWEVLPIAGLDFHYPPPAEGWRVERQPQPASRYIDTANGPYMPGIAEVLTKDGTDLLRRKGVAAWFRRRFTLGAAGFDGQRAVLVLKGAAFRHTTWVNGHEVGTSVQCAVPVEYDVTAWLKPGENEVLLGLTAREGLVDIARKCYVAPCNGMMGGLYDSVELQFRPPTTIDDVFVRTSVQRKRLDLDITLASSAPRRVVVGATVVDDGGRTLCRLPVQEVAAPGQVTLGADWLAPELWTPESPRLYTAVVTVSRTREEQRGLELRRELISPADKPPLPPPLLDLSRTRFGFREFGIKGRDFLLNGERVVLFRNSTLMALGPQSRAFPEMRATVTRPYNCVRLHLGQDNAQELDACDQFGMLAIPEANWSWLTCYPTASADVWLPNTLEFYRRWVRRHRNRPAVIMWSLCNETYWDSVKPDDMALAEQILKVVQAADPTRPQQGDGEVNWGGRLPALNIHYPEGEAGDVRRECPNSGLVVPNDLWWLKREGTNLSWRAGFTWDRPLMLGEYWNPGGSPDDQSSYVGDKNYDWEYWRHPASPRTPGAADELAALQKATDYYRLAGVACLNPWYGDRSVFLRGLDVRPMDYHPNAFAGQTLVRKVAVLNDLTPNQTWYEFGGMKLKASLAAGSRVLWTGELRASVWPGNSRTFDLNVVCPAVAEPTTAKLTVRLVEGRGVEAARYEETLYLLPPPTLAGLDRGAVLLLDSHGRTQKALAQLGCDLPAAPTLATDALAKAKLLIIGEETDAAPYAEAIRSWVGSGGRVVLLRQEAARTLAGELPEADAQHSAAMAWVRAPHHPLLAGLDEAQFRWWRPDHLVSRHTYHKPASGRFQVLLDCGGRYGMAWSPLAEVRVGQGLYIVTQLYLADRLAVEPLAGELLARLVRYGLAAAPPTPKPLRLLAGTNEALKRTLGVCGVVTKAGLTGDGPVMIDGSQALTPAETTALADALKAGGTVWLHRFTPEALAKLAALFPSAPELRAYDNTTQTGAIRANHAWADGLGTFDLYWSRVDLGTRGDPFTTGQVTAKLGDYTVAPSDAAQPLSAPAFLARVPVGRGALLLDELAWEDAYGAETAKVSRLVSTLTTNLGGDVRLATERDWSYFHVDLAPQVNMGYYDPVAGDGRGGWTDQGTNDMRFFLINHTGRAGGLEGAPEVAGEPWPGQVRLAGRPFRLVDPTRGDRKGVIALRGGEHCPTLPSEVKGLRVGHAAERLWFLHTACWSIDGKQHAEIGRYVIHYEDGSTTTVPLRYGLELQDWWDPAPLPNSRVAWTGRNLMHSPVGVWVTPWDNPSPDKPIATIDLVGNLSQSQIVLLGITGAVSAGGAAERTQARWLLADAAGDRVPNRVPGGPPLVFGKLPPTPFAADGHAGLAFSGGRQVTGDAREVPVFKAGGPFKLELSLKVDAPPVGYMGGLFESMQYLTSGFRLVYYQNLKLGVEIFPAPNKPSYLTGQTALVPGRFYRLALVFDGRRAQLLLDGKLDASVETAPPAPCTSGFRIGAAAGNKYDLVGVVEEVALSVPARR